MLLIARRANEWVLESDDYIALLCEGRGKKGLKRWVKGVIIFSSRGSARGPARVHRVKIVFARVRAQTRASTCFLFFFPCICVYLFVVIVCVNSLNRYLPYFTLLQHTQ